MNPKRMTWFVGFLLMLVTVQTGWSFYNPTTGRWLSRDPVGDESFKNKYSKMKSITQVLALEALMPTYLFARNNSINSFDAEGLRTHMRTCVLTVRAAHFRDRDEGLGNGEHFAGTAWNKLPRGDAYGYVGCGANTLHGKLSSVSPCALIPGMPVNNAEVDEDEPTPSERATMDKFGIPYNDTISETDGVEAIDAAFEAAKALARARCFSRTCGCCSEIKVKVECPHYETRILEQPVGSPRSPNPSDPPPSRQNGTPKCGKSIIMDCRTGDFSMLK